MSLLEDAQNEVRRRYGLDPIKVSDCDPDRDPCPDCGAQNVPPAEAEVRDERDPMTRALLGELGMTETELRYLWGDR